MVNPTTDMASRVRRLRDAITGAAVRCGRDPATVGLVAVSKTMPAEKVLSGVAAGLTIFGENYIQEAVDKIETVNAGSIHWHFIGHLQSNKAKTAVRFFDLIHTVDSLKLAEALNRHAEKMDKVQNVLVQVNLSEDTNKFGVKPSDATALVRGLSGLAHVSVKGLMTMPPYFDSPEAVRPYFRALSALAEDIRRQKIPGICMEELSMGMTGDFGVAIEEGATLVRIGTAIFGDRK